LVNQIAGGAESQAHQLFIERIQLAQGRNPKQQAPKQLYVPSEGALAGDEAIDQKGHFPIADFNAIDAVTKELEKLEHLGS
jgi:hypothetical protein